MAPRQQQRTRGALAEPRREQRRAADLRGDDRLDLVRLEDEQVGTWGCVLGVGQPDDDAVVGRGGLLVDVVSLTQPSADRQRQRPVHPQSIRRMQNHPPVAELVAEPLHHERGIGGHGVGGLPLVVEQAAQVLGGVLIETHCAHSAVGTHPVSGRRAPR